MAGLPGFEILWQPQDDVVHDNNCQIILLLSGMKFFSLGHLQKLLIKSTE